MCVYVCSRERGRENRRFFPCHTFNLQQRNFQWQQTREDSSIWQMWCVRIFFILRAHMSVRILKQILNRVNRPSVRSRMEKKTNLDFVAILHVAFFHSPLDLFVFFFPSFTSISNTHFQINRSAAVLEQQHQQPRHKNVIPLRKCARQMSLSSHFRSKFCRTNRGK